MFTIVFDNIAQKMKFPFRISPVNVTKSAVSYFISCVVQAKWNYEESLMIKIINEKYVYLNLYFAMA